MKMDEAGYVDGRKKSSKVVRLGWPDVADAAREETFRRLGELVQMRDAVPADVLESARFSFELRSVDDELAALVYDSVVDTDLLASVRSGGTASRQLTFASREIVLELEVPDGRSRGVIGQVVPPQPAEIELRHRTGTTSVASDELGCFELPVVPEGPVSFRCRSSQGAGETIATSWITF